MRCPHCHSSNIGGRKRRTSLGYRRFGCRDCRRTFNERSAGSFNYLAVSNSRRNARGAVATEVQAQPARCGGNPPRTRFQRDPRNHPRLGVPLRAHRGAAATRPASGPPVFLLVSGRDLREGRRVLMLPLSRYRSRREPGGLDAQRAPEPRRGPAVPPSTAGHHRAPATTGDDRSASCVSAGDPLDHREACSASDRAVPEQLHGAESSRAETAVVRLTWLQSSPAVALVRRVATTGAPTGGWATRLGRGATQSVSAEAGWRGPGCSEPL